jgi:glutamyl-tRNA reductase
MKEGENYEEWCKRVQMYEHGGAMQRIAEGDPIDSTLERMSKRITDKLLHPIFTEIRSTAAPYDAEAGKLAYKEKYLDHNAPKADQVED